MLLQRSITINSRGFLIFPVFVESDNLELLDDAINVINTLTRSEVFQVPKNSYHPPADALISKLDLSASIIVELDAVSVRSIIFPLLVVFFLTGVDVEKN